MRFNNQETHFLVRSEVTGEQPLVRSEETGEQPLVRGEETACSEVQ